MRILAGFATIAILSGLAGGASLIGMRQIADNYGEAVASARGAIITQELNGDVSSAKLHMLNYVLTREEEERENLKTLLAKAHKGAGAATSFYSGTPEGETLAEITGLLTDFETGIDRAIEQLQRRDTLVATVLQPHGEAVFTHLKETQTGAAWEWDQANSEKAGLAVSSFVVTRLAVADFLATSDFEAHKAALKNFQEFRKHIDELNGTLTSGLVREKFEPALALIAPYEAALAEIATVVAAWEEERQQSINTVGDLIKAKAESVVNDVNARSVAAAQSAGESRTATRNVVMFVNVIVLLSGVVLAFFIALGITRPLIRLVTDAESLAGGNTDVAFKEAARKDEIGHVARSIAGFRDGVKERARLEEAARAEQEATLQRQAKVRKLVDGFREDATRLLTDMTAQAGEMTRTASELSETAANTADRAGQMAGASRDMSDDVSAVAGSTEELTGSIHEITEQVSKASDVVSHANSQAQDATERVSGLARSSQRIGDVVSLIQDIAEQTNLLALNATIEAARAGDMGKGFAVVAAEVKELATQTAKATDEISGQIADIQSSTKGAVDAITEITATMGNVTEYTGAIASAVEEQGASTVVIRERSMRASTGTSDVATGMGEISDDVESTKDSASRVYNAATDLSARTESLKAGVEAFLGEVSAA